MACDFTGYIGVNNGKNRPDHCRGKSFRLCLFNANNRYMGVIMTLNEQKAFVAAFDNSFCNLPKEIVAAFVYDYKNKNSLEQYNIYPTSCILDALILWNYAIQYQLKQMQGVTA